MVQSDQVAYRITGFGDLNCFNVPLGKAGKSCVLELAHLYDAFAKFIARNFGNLMFKGKTHAALDLLANTGKGGVLHLEQPADSADPNSKTVKEILESKHPPAQPLLPSCPGNHKSTRFFLSTALRMKGDAGPLGLMHMPVYCLL